VRTLAGVARVADASFRDWDKFARAEYERLSAEDDGGAGGEPAIDEDDSGSMAWSSGGYTSGGLREAPF